MLDSELRKSYKLVLTREFSKTNRTSYYKLNNQDGDAHIYT